MPGVKRGLYFGGTERLEPTPPDGLDKLNVDNPTENSHADGSMAQTESMNDEFAHNGASNVTAGNYSHKTRNAGHNSNDARLIELKMQGYTDTYISKKLVEEGRVRYQPNTISGRFLRLKKAAEQAESEKLDDELSDWHVGEDDILQDAVSQMNKKYALEYDKLMEKKWKDVSDLVADKLEVKKYTGNACKVRWNALQDGSALKPIELDSDQEGRRIMREERIAAAKKRRADVKAGEQSKRDAIEQKRFAQQERKRAAAEQREEARKVKEADQAETHRLREERNRAKTQERAAIKEARQLWMAEIHETRRIRQLEERIYRNLTGKQLNRMRRLPPYEDVEDDDEDIPLGSSENSDDEEGYITDAELDAGFETENIQNEMEDNAGDREEDAYPFDISSDTGIPASTHLPPPTKVKVTAETLANPRSILTTAELEVLLFERGLPRRAQRETHPQIVARLAAADEALNFNAVSALLEKHFDRAKGTKAQKVLRLAEHDANNSAAGAQGVKATDLAFKMGYEGYHGKFAKLIR